MASTLYLNRSTYSPEASGLPQSFPNAMLIVTDDMANAPDVSAAFGTVDTTIFKSGAAAGAGDVANGTSSDWNVTLATQGKPYTDEGLKVFIYTLNVGAWDPNGTLKTPDAFVQTTTAALVTNPLPITESGNVVADLAPVRFAHPGDFTMVDVQAQNPSWLSSDTRTFRLNPGSNIPVGQTTALPIAADALWPPNPSATWLADDAVFAIKSMATYFNDQANAATVKTFFEALDSSEDSGSLMNEQQLEGGKPVYNFAVARVHGVNTGAKVLSAQVTFRLFVTLNMNLAYDGFSGLNYPTAVRMTTPPTRIAVLGRAGAGADPVCFPVFGDARTASGSPEDLQTDATNLLSFPIPPQPIPPALPKFTQDFFAFAHVDINDTTPRYADHTNNNQPLSALIKQSHVCMVVEIINPDDPTVPGTNPQSSGNLAQRNLSIGYLANPGVDPNVRTVQHNFEYVPHVINDAPVPVGVSHLPNELLFLTKKVPRGTLIDLFIPGFHAEKHFEEGKRPSLGERPPRHPIATGENTISFGIEQAVRIPVHVQVGNRYPALMTVRFPAGTDVGQRYDIDVLQLDPNAGIVVGAFRISSPVVKARTRVEGEKANAAAAARRADRARSGSPWSAVLVKQAEFAKEKARSTKIEAEHDGAEGKGKLVKVVLDRIEVPIARKEPITVNAYVYEGGHRVGTHEVRIPKGEPGIVPIEQVVFEGAMFDHFLVRVTDDKSPGRPILDEHAWTVEKDAIADVASAAGADHPIASGWRVWFHVVPKGR